MPLHPKEKCTLSLGLSSWLRLGIAFAGSGNGIGSYAPRCSHVPCSSRDSVASVPQDSASVARSREIFSVISDAHHLFQVFTLGAYQLARNNEIIPYSTYEDHKRKAQCANLVVQGHSCTRGAFPPFDRFMTHSQPAQMTADFHRIRASYMYRRAGDSHFHRPSVACNGRLRYTNGAAFGVCTTTIAACLPNLLCLHPQHPYARWNLTQDRRPQPSVQPSPHPVLRDEPSRTSPCVRVARPSRGYRSYSQTLGSRRKSRLHDDFDALHGGNNEGSNQAGAHGSCPQFNYCEILATSNGRCRKAGQEIRGRLSRNWSF